MARLLTCFMPRALVALVMLSSLHAQTPSANSPGAPSISPNSAASAQAPDEATRKISDLVHAGKYSEAQKLTEGLLIAYPDDQRLIQAKALIEKLLSSSATPGPPSANAPLAPAPAPPETAPLTGMDKVDYSALIELAKQAQESKDSVEQYRLMGRFMGQSVRFLQKHPEQMLLWRLRAAIAIAANQPMDGYEAGQRLLAAGGADSNDPALQQLLGQLRNKGWLDRQEAISAQNEALRQRVGNMYSGTWYGKVAAPNGRSPMAGCTDAEINHKCLFHNFIETDNNEKIHASQFAIQSDGTIIVSDRTSFAGCAGTVYGVPVGPAFKDVRWEIRPAGEPARQIFSGYVEDGSQFGFSCNRPQSGDYKSRYNYVIWQRTLDSAPSDPNSLQNQRRK